MACRNNIYEFDGFWERLLRESQNQDFLDYEVTIELKEVDGVFKVPEPHEDIHNPDYFEAIKDKDKLLEKYRKLKHTPL